MVPGCPTYGKVGRKKLFNMREKYPTPEPGRERNEEEWAEKRATELVERFLRSKEEEEANRIRDLFMRFEGLNKEEATEKAGQEIMRRKKEKGQWILNQEKIGRGITEGFLDLQARNLLSEAILYEGKWSEDWSKREKILEHGLKAAKNEVRKQWEEEKKMAKEG